MARTSATARIENVALVDVKIDITASYRNAKIGALAGNNEGKIIACYSTGAITAAAADGHAYHVGGLVGHNTATGTIAAAFSRATVDVSAKSAAPATDFYASGGLVGHNSGTLTATYAAGAVKGKAGGGYVGGLVGFNTPPDGAPSGTKTIIASYSIAPVTSLPYATTDGAPKPTVGGLTGCCNDTTTTNTITASYWDYISSGVPDDLGDAMLEGKSTHDLISPVSFDTGVYVDWEDLTIDGANDVDPWVIDAPRFHPMLTYGGHTTAIPGNQLFVNSGISSRYGGDTVHPREGMTLVTNVGSYRGAFAPFRKRGSWIWETSTDGITWNTLVPPPGKRFILTGALGTYRFVPRPDHVGKYIRAGVPLTTGGYAYTRVIGKIKDASTDAPIAMSFASGHNPPHVGTAVTIASLPTTPTSVATGLWYRCDDNDANPPSTGCELVGSLTSHIPRAADLEHFLYAYIYYKEANVWKRTSIGFTTQKVADIQAGDPYRIE